MNETTRDKELDELYLDKLRLNPNSALAELYFTLQGFPDLAPTTISTLTPGDINFWKPTGFVRVCNIKSTADGYWYYSDIETQVMYSSHCSWVYFIVVNGKIWKIGETGNPLGIKGTTAPMCVEGEWQPVCNTTSRTGRYRQHPEGTDARCREVLLPYTTDPKATVEFWAWQCPESELSIPVGNQMVDVRTHPHKDAEKVFLDIYYKHFKRYPELNVGRA